MNFSGLWTEGDCKSQTAKTKAKRLWNLACPRLADIPGMSMYLRDHDPLYLIGSSATYECSMGRFHSDNVRLNVASTQPINTSTRNFVSVFLGNWCYFYMPTKWDLVSNAWRSPTLWSKDLPSSIERTTDWPRLAPWREHRTWSRLDHQWNNNHNFMS